MTFRKAHIALILLTVFVSAELARSVHFAFRHRAAIINEGWAIGKPAPAPCDVPHDFYFLTAFVFACLSTEFSPALLEETPARLTGKLKRRETGHPLSRGPPESIRKNRFVDA